MSTFYIESYGCQMNFSDSEIVSSILEKEGYRSVPTPEKATLLLLNTCSIREKAEQTIRKRIATFSPIIRHNHGVKVAILGCMAERLKAKLLEEEKLVDLVIGPDAYRTLPSLIEKVETTEDTAINTLLSKEETYDDIEPIRLGGNGVTAFTSIMRGCDNMCTFCVVPFTRGRERSRNPQTIIQETKKLYVMGYRQVTLLGQNVDSYLWFGGGPKKDFKKLSAFDQSTAINFASLLEMVALAVPEMRVRFSTSNPQDMTLDVLDTIARYPNICKYIHLPVQSGSTRILEAMNRGYTRDEYMRLIDAIRERIPDCAISHDIIAGFPTETDADHRDTLSMMEYVKYDFGYMFNYSERPGTPAAKHLADDIPAKIKSERLQQIISLQNTHSLERNRSHIGRTETVLIEGRSKKSNTDWMGRNTQNTTVIFPKVQGTNAGDYVEVEIHDANSATLFGRTSVSTQG